MTKGSSPPPPQIVESEPKSMPNQSALPSPPTSSKGTTASPISKFSTSPPSEWSVDDVVEWAKSKGFDSSVTDKFVGECL